MITFTGRRAGAAGQLSPGDWFERKEAVRLVPGSGPDAVTVKVEGVSAGEWLVRARPAGHARLRAVDPDRLRDGGCLRRVRRVLWMRGNPVTPAGPGTRVGTRAAARASALGIGAAAPGLFLAMAIGQQGCFFSGCCAGHPTGSRWGIWSSDGRIGVRRVPAQHLESLACLLIGAAALAAFLRLGASAGGAVFIGAVAVYTLVRQGLLALRDQPRRWSLALPVTLAGAVIALVADILITASGAF